MKRVLLLFGKEAVSQGKADPEKLTHTLNAAAKNLTNYAYAYYEDLLHTITPHNGSIVDTVSGSDIASYDFVYQRRWGDCPHLALSCAIYLGKKGVPFIDKESYRLGAMDKLSQHWRLWEHDLPFPSTIFLPSENRKSSRTVEVPDYFGYPLVAKSSTGTRGEDNHLIKSAEELNQLLSNNPSTGYLVQQYIPNDCDYRVLVGVDQILLVIKRTAPKGSHTNNTSKGGTATLMPHDYFEPAIKTQIIEAAQAFGRDFAGVDVVFDKNTGKHYFFEVNRSPQLEDSSFLDEKAQAFDGFIQKIMGQ